MVSRQDILSFAHDHVEEVISKMADHAIKAVADGIVCPTSIHPHACPELGKEVAAKVLGKN